jgi:hypothetical protein
MLGQMLFARDMMAEQRWTYERWRYGPVDGVRQVEARGLKA